MLSSASFEGPFALGHDVRAQHQAVPHQAQVFQVAVLMTPALVMTRSGSNDTPGEIESLQKDHLRSLSSTVE
eukprot:1009725-Pyramimonas_sp.AAC.1